MTFGNLFCFDTCHFEYNLALIAINTTQLSNFLYYCIALGDIFFLGAIPSYAVCFSLLWTLLNIFSIKTAGAILTISEDSNP